MSTITAETALTVVKMLAKGQTVEFVAAATSLTEDLVLTIAVRHGHPDKAKLGWAADVLQSNLDRARREQLPAGSRIPGPRPQAVPAPPGVAAAPAPRRAENDELSELLADGLAALRPGTRHLAKRIQEQVKKLREQLQADVAGLEEERKRNAEREQLISEEAALQTKLKAVRARLGKKAPAAGVASRRSNPATAARAAHQAEVLERHGVTRQDVMDWAATAGLEVGKYGTIPRQALDAFEASRG